MKTPLLDLGIYRVVQCGWDTVRTELTATGEIITPAGYSGPDREAAAIYFTEKFLKEQMDKEVEMRLLGEADAGRNNQQG